jgi:hypothetical protein
MPFIKVAAESRAYSNRRLAELAGVPGYRTITEHEE